MVTLYKHWKISHTVPGRLKLVCGPDTFWFGSWQLTSASPDNPRNRRFKRLEVGASYYDFLFFKKTKAYQSTLLYGNLFVGNTKCAEILVLNLGTHAHLCSSCPLQCSVCSNEVGARPRNQAAYKDPLNMLSPWKKRVTAEVSGGSFVFGTTFIRA